MKIKGKIAEPGGSLDAENACGLTGKLWRGASDLGRYTGI